MKITVHIKNEIPVNVNIYYESKDSLKDIKVDESKYYITELINSENPKNLALLNIQNGDKKGILAQRINQRLLKGDTLEIVKLIEIL